jgi:sec-independent protein translocase protein TatA
MLGLGPPELIIIALVILALFGYKRLPDAARAIGRSARIFKAETKGLRDDPAPRDLESRAEAQYVREAPPPAAAAPSPPPAAPPPAAASPTPAPSATPMPSPTPAPSPAPSPSATPARPAEPVRPQSETR